MRAGCRRRRQISRCHYGSARAVFDAAVAIVIAIAMRGAVMVVIVVEVHARRAMVVYGAEADGHRCERAQRHERQDK